eukprot:4531075-Prorocentrum_lima.AAC.1
MESSSPRDSYGSLPHLEGGIEDTPRIQNERTGLLNAEGLSNALGLGGDNSLRSRRRIKALAATGI